MKVFLTNTFKRAMKKLHNNRLPKLEEAIKQIQDNPHIGELKIGNLAGVRIYKFSIFNQLTLLAYSYNEQEDELMMLAFAPHENFYRDLKR
jgi:mRNA-degrading endonuclease RelE of RelBE toxin-antitoxin system